MKVVSKEVIISGGKSNEAVDVPTTTTSKAQLTAATRATSAPSASIYRRCGPWYVEELKADENPMNWCVMTYATSDFHSPLVIAGYGNGIAEMSWNCMSGR